MITFYLIFLTLFILSALHLRKENKRGYLPLEIRTRLQAEKAVKNTSFENWKVKNFYKLWKIYQQLEEPVSFDIFVRDLYNGNIELIL